VEMAARVVGVAAGWAAAAREAVTAAETAVVATVAAMVVVEGAAGQRSPRR
jgi:hypothetical protein